MDALHDAMGRVQEMVADRSAPYDDRMASHFAYLLEKTTRVMEAARKVDAHYHRFAKTASAEERDALVVAYIQDLPRARRDAIRSLIDEMDAENLALLS